MKSASHTALGTFFFFWEGRVFLKYYSPLNSRIWVLFSFFPKIKIQHLGRHLENVGNMEQVATKQEKVVSVKDL